MERFTTEPRAAIRDLRRSPALLAAAVVTLVIAVGINLAMLGLIDRALLSPPAFVIDPSRVYILGFAVPGDDGNDAQMASTSYVTFKAIRDAAPGIESAAAFQRAGMTLLADGEQHSVAGMMVSGGYFKTLGAAAVIGRVFNAADDVVVSAQSPVVLTDALWRRAFRGDPKAIGRTVSIGGLAYTIAGVMPPGFSGHSTTNVDVFVLFSGALRDSPGWDGNAFRNIAGVLLRVPPTATNAAVTTQLTTAINRGVSLRPVGAEIGGSERRIAWWLCALAALVFAIGLANTATLLVVRGSRARRNMSIRLTLGASPQALRRQALMEASILAAIVVALSGALTLWMDETVRRILFANLISRASVSGMSLWASLGAGVLVTMVIAAANTSQIPPLSSISRSTVNAEGGRRRNRAMTGLLVLQTSLAMILLAGAGLFGASVYRLWDQDFGMRLDSLYVIDFEPGPALVNGQDDFFTDAAARVRSYPGVELATTIDALPFAGFNVPPISVPGLQTPPSINGQLPFMTAATPEFLRILDLRIVQGRGLTQADEHGAPVVLVNETMAKQVWPGQNAIGKCVRIGFDAAFDLQSFDPSNGPPTPGDGAPCREVVGVTRDVRQRSVLPFDGEDRWMQYFVPFAQVPVPPFVPNPTRINGLLIKTASGNDLPIASVRALLVGGRTDLPFLRVRPYTDLLAAQMRPWNMGARLLGLFSLLSLAVAAIGLYAAFAHAVRQRLHEMAVRLAVGARPGEVRTLILKEALRVASVGIGTGSLCAIASGRWLRTLLFGTQTFDPIVLGTSSALLFLVAALATLLPAYHASQADPSTLLRSE